jgi:hypothetical protein
LDALAVSACSLPRRAEVTINEVFSLACSADPYRCGPSCWCLNLFATARAFTDDE